MKKYIILFSLLLIVSLSVYAQLIMNRYKKVAIGTEAVDFDPLLRVGDNWYFDETDDTKTGTGGSPIVGNGNNIGVYGQLGISPNFSQSNNYR